MLIRIGDELCHSVAASFPESCFLVVENSIDTDVKLVGYLVLIQAGMKKLHNLKLSLGKVAVELWVAYDLVILAFASHWAWDEFKPECTGIKVQYIIKISEVAFEKPTHDQELIIE